MSKSKSHITVNAHTRRAPTRVVVVATPAAVDPRPSLPRTTSPTQQTEYDYYSQRTADGGREYHDTIVDRAIDAGSDDDAGEY